jgi:ribosomal protein S27AE
VAARLRKSPAKKRRRMKAPRCAAMVALRNRQRDRMACWECGDCWLTEIGTIPRFFVSVDSNRDKALCFDTSVQVFILKVLRVAPKLCNLERLRLARRTYGNVVPVRGQVF